MNHDKKQLAAMLRNLAARADRNDPGLPEQLKTAAQILEMEHKADQRREEIANADTAECPMCHGLRLYFDGQDHIQCPQCRGWGRVLPSR